MNPQSRSSNGTTPAACEGHTAHGPRLLSPTEMKATLASAQALAPTPASPARLPAFGALETLTAMDWLKVLLATDQARIKLTQYPDGPAHWIGALVFLSTQPAGEASQEAVRDVMGTSPSSVSRFVITAGRGDMKIVGRGWLDVRADPANRRQNLVRLTESGWAVVNALATAASTEAQRRMARATTRKVH